MFSGLISLLGGAAFRAITGQLFAFLDKRQEHRYEIERTTLQGKLDADRHVRDLEHMRLASELGIKEITVAGDIEIEKRDADAFLEAMRHAQKPSGIWLVDLWNGLIRPVAATIALVLWFVTLAARGFMLTPFDVDLVCAILGYFFADRQLGKRQK